MCIWIPRDTPLNEGGGALDRAGRFLRGQVQRDFAFANAVAADPMLQGISALNL